MSKMPTSTKVILGMVVAAVAGVLGFWGFVAITSLTTANHAQAVETEHPNLFSNAMFTDERGPCEVFMLGEDMSNWPNHRDILCIEGLNQNMLIHYSQGVGDSSSHRSDHQTHSARSSLILAMSPFAWDGRDGYKDSILARCGDTAKLIAFEAETSHNAAALCYNNGQLLLSTNPEGRFMSTVSNDFRLAPYIQAEL